MKFKLDENIGDRGAGMNRLLYVNDVSERCVPRARRFDEPVT